MDGYCKMEKKVRFPEKDLVQVKHLHVWTFASREARKSVWMDIAKDRAHFKFKILHKFSKLLDPVMESKYMQFQANISGIKIPMENIRNTKMKK